jgi:type IV pilus assembly protein PilC
MSNIFLKVPVQEKIIFARHLAIMVKASMSLVDGLKMLKKQTKSKSMAKILDQLASDVSSGQFLASSMEKFKNIFGDLFINVIRVGEAGGILYENLNYLAEELKKKNELRKKIIGAFIYPAVVIGSTFGIAGLLAVYIFPKIVPVFTSLGVKLPFTTRALMATSSFLINNGLWVLVGLIVFIIAIWLIRKIRLVSLLLAKVTLGIPLIGKMVRDYNLANFCRTLGLLLKSDIKVVEAVNTTADSLSNLAYKNALKKIAQEVIKGEEISKHLEKNTHLFPPMLTQMIAVGEKTGNLSETFLYISDFYEEELDEVVKNLSVVLEPILMVMMGVIVGFVAVSIITPIYSVTQNLGR